MGFRTTKLGFQVAMEPKKAKAAILAALKTTSGDMKAAAQLLDVSRPTLYTYVERLGVTVKR